MYLLAIIAITASVVAFSETSLEKKRQERQASKQDSSMEITWFGRPGLRVKRHSKNQYNGPWQNAGEYSREQGRDTIRYFDGLGRRQPFGGQGSHRRDPFNGQAGLRPFGGYGNSNGWSSSSRHSESLSEYDPAYFDDLEGNQDDNDDCPDPKDVIDLDIPDRYKHRGSQGHRY